MDGTVSGRKAWNTFVEETVSAKKPASGTTGRTEKRQEPVILRDISLSEDERQTTKIGELDRVLGGGIVPGSLVLVGGVQGIRQIDPSSSGMSDHGMRDRFLFCIFQEKNLCARSNCGPIVSENSAINCSCFVRRIWK